MQYILLLMLAIFALELDMEFDKHHSQQRQIIENQLRIIELLEKAPLSNQHTPL